MSRKMLIDGNEAVNDSSNDNDEHFDFDLFVIGAGVWREPGRRGLRLKLRGLSVGDLQLSVESVGNRNAGENCVRWYTEIPSDAYKKARSAMKSANPGKPSSKRKRPWFCDM
ncbi:hypothetical protein Tco_0959575 [Tanacetum coccineum]